MTGTFATELEEFVDGMIGNMPDEARKGMQDAFAELAPIRKDSLKVGDKAPEFTLPNQDGVSVSSTKLLKQGPLVINFYRGGWCPICNFEMAALMKLLPEMRELGAELIGICPEVPELVAETHEKNKINFDVLSDLGNKAASDFGIVFTQPEFIKARLLEFKLDLTKKNGDESWTLPFPATYVIGQDGKVLYAFVDEDYTTRGDPADVLAALKAG